MQQAYVTEPVAAAAWSAAALRRINDAFQESPAEELLSWIDEQFGVDAVLTCSFGGVSGMVLLDMLARLRSAISVIFLDTDLLFPETYALAEAAAQRYGVTIQHRRPPLTLAEQAQREGPQLYRHDPDRCCGLRKVAPLAEALRPYDVWISGIRRDQTTSRAATPLIEWSTRHQVLKINPLAFWTEREVWSYVYAYDVPYNRLLDQGYTSLGCIPCTLPAKVHDPRAGRWVGFAKTECGIHL